MLTTILIVLGILFAVYWAFAIGASIGRTHGWGAGYDCGWNAAVQKLEESIKKSYRFDRAL